MAPKKFGNGLVALCTLAVGAVYGAGYLMTSHQSTQSTQNLHTVDSHRISNVPAKTSTIANHSTNEPDSTSNSKKSGLTKQTSSNSSNSATSTNQYLDGTYTGSGSNDIGSVEVAVVIKNGKIADVQITSCDTHYPESFIDPQLPQEVVATQSPNVNVVSGATKSTEDFETAVYEALSQAQNPKYSPKGE
ncbi:FMN-binding protein [Alicyclobacillus fodiniaquatilis]|uniref:FMN-binding protein n=1 Tax=Alicyclobacillus fodiniaquatilis TaxID=1661150 RepID=A0ABW4JIN6_9BACL